MKKINLIFWNSPNFGDLLSPFIVSSLSACKTYYKYKAKRWWTELIICLLKFDFSKILHILYPWQKSLISIGSVIAWGNRQSVVWGAGLLRRDEAVAVGRIYAVRGKYTRDVLLKKGYFVPEIYGDPAILLPLIYHPKSKMKLGKIGIIPNWEETDFFLEKYGTIYHVIDLRTDRLCDVIEDIVSCEYILSTSLHGIIVAHTYGVKALWIKKGNIQTDGIKFDDYFSSVQIDRYSPIENFDVVLMDKNNIKKLFVEKTRFILPSPLVIDNLRKGLLLSAPFELASEYKKYLN